MEIRDILHGSIPIDHGEVPILDSRYLQRLRSIKQLGFTEFSFPSATHNRFTHSLGAMHTASQAFDHIFTERAGFGAAVQRFRPLVRLAALLHDIGHGPLSHTSEFAMPAFKGRASQTTHEDYTLKMVLDSGLTPILEQTIRPRGFTPTHIANLIDPKLKCPDDFLFERVQGEKINFRPILEQLISSELDADRMDYLRRDSFVTGVTYGHFDFDWIVSNLTFHLKDKKCFLTLNHRALFSFEDFLISRFHMFLMVYFHHKSVIYDEMLGQYFKSPECDYKIPSDIEKYCEYTDAHLLGHLEKSRDPWAMRISEKRPYRLLVELHSGIPATKTAASEQERLHNRIQKSLQSSDIHYLAVASTSELSKYFGKPGAPIYIRYDNYYSAPTYIPLGQCTDVFERYSAKRVISRLYVSPEDYPKCRFEGRKIPLRFEEDNAL